MSHIHGTAKEHSPGIINGDQNTSINGQLQNVIGSSGDDEQSRNIYFFKCVSNPLQGLIY